MRIFVIGTADQLYKDSPTEGEEKCAGQLWLINGILSLLFGLAGTGIAFYHAHWELLAGKYFAKPLSGGLLFGAGVLGLCAWGFAFYGVCLPISLLFSISALLTFSLVNVSKSHSGETINVRKTRNLTFCSQLIPFLLLFLHFLPSFCDHSPGFDVQVHYQ